MRNDCIDRLRESGISYDDAVALRRISMTLHRWHELECGDGNDYASWCIVRGYETNKPGYWHQANPWASELVYVPLVELAHCAAGGTVDARGVLKPFDFECVLQHWRQCGRIKLDGYILPQPSGDHSIGVRYGAKAEMYYSPHNANPEKTARLLATYRDWKPARGFMYDDVGKPHIERHAHSENKPSYTLIADREAGAQRRLARIMARYPGMSAYVQGDPRGASLYILRPGDVPEGSTVDNCYNRGVAVYK